MSEALEEWGIQSPDHYTCDCGFEGNTPVWEFRNQKWTQCVGCNQLKVWDGEFFVDASPPDNMKPQEMTDFLAHVRIEAVQKPTKTVAKKKPARKGVADDNVYVTMNFFTRSNDSYRKVLSDAREEVQARPDTTAIFAHDHPYGQSCTDKCKKRIEVK